MLWQREVVDDHRYFVFLLCLIHDRLCARTLRALQILENNDRYLVARGWTQNGCLCVNIATARSCLLMQAGT